MTSDKQPRETSPRPLMVNVTFAPDEAIVDRFLSWAGEEYMRCVVATPGCSEPVLLRVAAADQGNARAYAIQFRAATPATAIEWLESSFGSLMQLFPGGLNPQQLPYYPSVMEIVDER